MLAKPASGDTGFIVTGGGCERAGTGVAAGSGFTIGVAVAKGL